MSDNDDIQRDSVTNSLEQLERQLFERINLFGYEDFKVHKMQTELCKILNHQAVLQLQVNNYNKSMEYLKRCETLTQYVPEFKIQTFNNLACFYRKVGKPRTALKYLQQALQIELQLPKSSSLSDTYLNLCAVFSQLDRHDEALQHIYMSIIMLQHDLLLKSFNNNELTAKQSSINIILVDQSSNVNTTTYSNRQINSSNNQPLQERIGVLVVAYHNLGVEMEHLKRNMEATKIFQSALQLADQNLPINHKMISTLKTILGNAQKGDTTLLLTKHNFPLVPGRDKPVLKSMSPSDGMNSLRASTKVQQKLVLNQNTLDFGKSNNKTLPFRHRNSKSQNKQYPSSQEDRKRLHSIQHSEQITQQNDFLSKETSVRSNLPSLAHAQSPFLAQQKLSQTNQYFKNNTIIL